MKSIDLSIRYPDCIAWMEDAFIRFERVEAKINKHLDCGDVETVLSSLSHDDTGHTM